MGEVKTKLYTEGREDSDKDLREKEEIYNPIRG